jgi:hypothetical protein
MNRWTSQDPEIPDLVADFVKKRKGGQASWRKRPKYTSSMNNGHKHQGWSEVGKLRFNMLMDDVENSRNNPVYDNVEEGMLEKWKSMGGKRRRDGNQSRVDMMPGNVELVTATRLSAGAKAKYGFLGGQDGLAGNLSLEVKDEPHFEDQCSFENIIGGEWSVLVGGEPQDYSSN